MSVEKLTKWVYVVGIVGVLAAIGGVVLIATSRQAAAERGGARAARVEVAKARGAAWRARRCRRRCASSSCRARRGRSRQRHALRQGLAAI